ncbi:hypothetical protein HYDPIDRAFT_117292 [Hydnomerulius pinastri MD-312]|uniref:DUF7918 domain-containing protein n=1 Tax=Hydnomerulius pinastri MD-312 TaxID=994086 RepID=A0A0C9WAA5_9AGAM|nr:hypothetical protein HYDPIDRAFT_117292 [Hydnomerulius pinastri MD-312]
MLNFEEISAWVEVDGQELEQYGVEENLEKNEVTCWIATQAGKNFSIAYRDNAPYREVSLASYPTLDGSDISGRVLRPNNQSRTIRQSDQAVSATSRRSFMFSKLQLTDEDEYLGQASKHLGEIKLQIRRVEINQMGIVPSVTNLSGQSKVHERSKKAVSHCVSYGQETKSEPTYNVGVRHLDVDPLVAFIFKYRDYDLLQANGIIPKPPAVERKPAVPEDVLDLTIDNDVKEEPAGDEIRALDDAIRAMRQKRAALQSKRSNSGESSSQPPAKRVKREKSVPSGEVIDLT